MMYLETKLTFFYRKIETKLTGQYSNVKTEEMKYQRLTYRKLRFMVK